MSNMTKTMAVFAGSTCPELAEDIATALGTTLGNVKLEKFSNGEIYARYLESVRGADVFIVQSTSTPNVNEAVMERQSALLLVPLTPLFLAMAMLVRTARLLHVSLLRLSWLPTS